MTPKEWRAALGRFPTGVSVVTSWKGRDPVGTTANALASVSLEPALLLVCLDISNPALGPVETSGLFGVNLLGDEHLEIALRFSRPPEEGRFSGLDWGAAETGAPELSLAPVFIDCALEQTHRAGDHKILVGRGVRITHNSAAAPLLYHRGVFPRLA